MRMLCDVCEGAAARVFCAADEAALCHACDVKVHGCNKLASRHTRVELAEARAAPNCDICEDAPAFFFCAIDGTSLCLQCDMDVHVGGKSSHDRYLLLGQRVEAPSTDVRDAQNLAVSPVSSSGKEAADGGDTNHGASNNHTHTHNHSHHHNGSSGGSNRPPRKRRVTDWTSDFDDTNLAVVPEMGPKALAALREEQHNHHHHDNSNGNVSSGGNGTNSSSNNNNNNNNNNNSSSHSRPPPSPWSSNDRKSNLGKTH
eukprot:jgi/Chlat1/8887/Chrsp92S08200